MRYTACTKVELHDLTVFIAVNGQNVHHLDLDLDPTRPDIERVQAIFIYTYIFNFYIPGWIILK